MIVIHAVEFSKTLQTHLRAHEQRLVYHRPSSCLLFSFSFCSFVFQAYRRRQCQRRSRRQQRRRAARTQRRDNENASKPSLNWLLRPHKRKGSERTGGRGEKKRRRELRGSRLENARISSFKGDIIQAGIFIFMKQARVLELEGNCSGRIKKWLEKCTQLNSNILALRWMKEDIFFVFLRQHPCKIHVKVAKGRNNWVKQSLRNMIVHFYRASFIIILWSLWNTMTRTFIWNLCICLQEVRMLPLQNGKVDFSIS